MTRTLEGSAQVIKKATCESPLISVVLPTFNRAALLPQSIESVLSQTERSFELIIVDDGSSDATGEILSGYAAKDERITHVRQQNLGLPRTLNNGFRLARGEFFTWTSDDNRYLPEAFAIMSRHLREREDVGFVFAGMLRRRCGSLVHYPIHRPEKVWEYNKFGAAFMYRRSVAELVGEYDPAMALVEDYDYFLRLSLHTVARHLPDVVYEYNDHAESLTALRPVDQVRALERLLRKHLNSRTAGRPALSRLAATVSGAYRRAELRGDAFRLAWIGWRLWPLNLRCYAGVVLTLGSWIHTHRGK